MFPGPILILGDISPFVSWVTQIPRKHFKKKHLALCIWACLKSRERRSPRRSGIEKSPAFSQWLECLRRHDLLCLAALRHESTRHSWFGRRDIRTTRSATLAQAFSARPVRRKTKAKNAGKHECCDENNPAILLGASKLPGCLAPFFLRALTPVLCPELETMRSQTCEAQKKD